MSHLWLFGVLALGATGRLTRLITADTLTAPLRRAFTRIPIATKHQTWAAEFVTCPWCVSVWIAPAVLALGWWPAHHGADSWWWFPAAWLTVAWTVGVLTSALDGD